MPYIKAYLDDILVHSKNEEQHVSHLIETLSILRKTGLSINWSKKNLFTKEVYYIGHKITSEGLKPDIRRINSYKLLEPKMRKQVMKLLGFIQCFRLPMAVKILSFLSEKLKKVVPYEWSNEDTTKVKKLIHEIKSETLLKFPRFDLPFDFKTDASEKAFGATVSQNDYPIGFYSLKLNETEMNYTTTEKEFYSIFRTLVYFKTLLFGSKIRVHSNNLNLLRKSEISKRISRWKIVISEYNIELGI